MVVGVQVSHAFHNPESELFMLKMILVLAPLALNLMLCLAFDCVNWHVHEYPIWCRQHAVFGMFIRVLSMFNTKALRFFGYCVEDFHGPTNSVEAYDFAKKKRDASRLRARLDVKASNTASIEDYLSEPAKKIASVVPRHSSAQCDHDARCLLCHHTPELQPTLEVMRYEDFRFAISLLAK